TKDRHISVPVSAGLEIGCRRASQSAASLFVVSAWVKEKNGLIARLSPSKTEDRLTRTIEWISVLLSQRLSGISRYSRRVWSRRIGSVVRETRLMIGAQPSLIVPASSVRGCCGRSPRRNRRSAQAVPDNAPAGQFPMSRNRNLSGNVKYSWSSLNP